jgi:hypothetical protein
MIAGLATCLFRTCHSGSSANRAGRAPCCGNVCIRRLRAVMTTRGDSSVRARGAVLTKAEARRLSRSLRHVAATAPARHCMAWLTKPLDPHSESRPSYIYPHYHPHHRPPHQLVVLSSLSLSGQLYTRTYLPTHTKPQVTHTYIMAQFIADTLKHVPGVDPRMAQRAQAFQGLNDGPAETAARLTGMVQESHAFDDSPV